MLDVLAPRMMPVILPSFLRICITYQSFHDTLYKYLNELRMSYPSKKGDLLHTISSLLFYCLGKYTFLDNKKGRYSK